MKRRVNYIKNTEVKLEKIVFLKYFNTVQKIIYIYLMKDLTKMH